HKVIQKYYRDPESGGDDVPAPFPVRSENPVPSLGNARGTGATAAVPEVIVGVTDVDPETGAPSISMASISHCHFAGMACFSQRKHVKAERKPAYI
ncbi:putative RNA-binding protein, partial [Naja naja]